METLRNYVAIDPSSLIFKIMSYKYFRAHFLYISACNSTGSAELKHLRQRTSGDTNFEKLIPLQLSLESDIGLKNGVADFGSVLNYFSFPF
jgi:hypothetical protein